MSPLALAGVLAIISASARAGAEVLVSLDYQADPALSGCPSGTEFQAAIAQQLGRDPFRRDAPRHMVVRFTGSGARILGRIEWRDAGDQWEGERTFSARSESCQQMARAMALATAIQIQLLALAEPAGDAAPPVLQVVPAQPARPPVAPPAPVARPVVVEPPVVPEPGVGIEGGLAVMKDVGGSRATVAPRVAVTLGRPSRIGLRLGASGLGPTSEVTAAEGSARIDRLVLTLQLVHFFRARRRVQPFVALGAGWQELRVQGSSNDPMLGQSHDGQSAALLALGGGGVAVGFAPGLYVVFEAEATLYRPDVTVVIGSTTAAHFGGEGLLAHGGVLARF